MKFSTCAKLLLTGLASVAATLALAQSYPDKPIKLVVPFPPGGGADNLARSVIPRVGEILGQPDEAIFLRSRTGAAFRRVFESHRATNF